MAEQAADFRRVIEKLGSGSKTAIGISRGGTLALILARDHPGLLDRIALVGTPVDDLVSPGCLYPRPDALSEKTLQAVEDGDFQTAASIASHSVFSEDGYFDFAENSIRIWLAHGEATARRLLIGFHGPNPELDIKPWLGTVRIPTLVTHGVNDRRAPYAVSKYIANQIPGALHFGFPGRGHEPLFTAPAEFLAVLDQFIKTGTVPSPTRSG